MTLSYGGQLALFPQLNGIIPGLLGFAASLMLFASVVAHELGHSFVALAQGIEVKSITLFLFGGLAALGEESKTPLQAFLVAIAGPVVSLLLFGLFTLIGLTIPLPPFMVSIVYLLATINLILALFNLIPGLPLDGGNVLKAIVWKVTGNSQKGVIFASRLGQFFGWTAIVIGALGTLNLISFGNFWTLLIGWFLLQNAGFAAQSARLEDKLSNYIAADAVIESSPIVRENLSLREFANEYVIGKKVWQKFLVTNELGQLIGVLNLEDLKKVSTSVWTETLVKDIMKSSTEVKTISDSVSLLQVAKMLEKQAEKELTVVKEDGFVVGLIEKNSIINFLQKQLVVNNG
jgi:Zn-dependent protease/CBS domain-containing protein